MIKSYVLIKTLGYYQQISISSSLKKASAAPLNSAGIAESVNSVEYLSQLVHQKCLPIDKSQKY